MALRKITDATAVPVKHEPAVMHEMMGMMTQYIAQASGPKRIVRGPDGRAVGVEPAQ